MANGFENTNGKYVKWAQDKTFSCVCLKEKVEDNFFESIKKKNIYSKAKLSKKIKNWQIFDITHNIDELIQPVPHTARGFCFKKHK